MRNYIQRGEVLTLTAPYDCASGDGALVGAVFGVATGTIANGARGEFCLEGVHLLPKTSAQAWTEGQRIFWDATNRRCDSDPTVGQLIGAATQAAANPSSTGYVLLNESVPVLSEGAQAAIADIATADATDLASAEALANATKAKLNTLLAELRTAGIIAAS